MITRVVAKNFLSWADLDITFAKGVTLIDGWNEDDQTPEGCGKSAILNAISWCFFGKIPKDANIDDVIKEGEKACFVEVHFSDGSVVKRSRKPNDILLIRAGVENRGTSANETLRMVEEFVGLTFETFCQTIYFAQNYVKKFVTANQEEKGKILSEAQDLTLFDRASKEVKALMKLDEDALTQLRHGKELAIKNVELLKRDVASERMKREHAAQAQAQQIKNLNLQIEAEQRRHATELQRQADLVAGLERQVGETQQLIVTQKAAQDALMATVSTLVYDEPREKILQEANNQLNGQMGVVGVEMTDIDKLSAKRDLAQSQGKRYATRYKQIQAEREKNLAFIANPSKNCPTCGTQLQACDTSHAQTEVAAIDKELADITVALTALAAEIDVPVPTKDELQAKLTGLRQARALNDNEMFLIRSVKDRMSTAASQLSMMEQTIKTYQDKIVKLTQQVDVEKRPFSVDTAQLDRLKVQLEAESRPLMFDDSNLNALLVKTTTEEGNVQDFDRLVAEKQKHLTRLTELRDGFKEIKSHVFNSMLNEINARVHKYLAQLFEVPVQVRFTNTDMKIETEVKYDGIERSLGLLSGGQFRRVSLAVDLALSDTIVARKGSKIGVLILDEYFKDLSEPSMEKCLSLLEGRNQPVLLIEHNSIFKNIVNNSINVRLEDGTSRVQVHGS